MRRFSLVILALFGTTASLGCSYYPELILRGEPSELNTALTALPTPTLMPVSMRFQLEDPSLGVLASGESSPPGPGGGPDFRLSYPAAEMLQRAGEATVTRWTVPDGQSGKPIILTAKLTRLYYHSVSNYFNRAQALVAVTVHVRATYLSKMILDTTYESGKQYSEPFPIGVHHGVGERFEQHFSETVYKALLIALDNAMADLAAKRATKEFEVR
jgi:hypothetical protein